MTPNAEDFNNILNEINAKLDYMSSHNDRQSIDELKNQVSTLEKTFNDSVINFNFEKEAVFENIQKEITAIIEKSSILKDLFPQNSQDRFQSVENTINANLSRVHTDLSETVKQDFNQVAQGIGALYARIELLKNSVDNKEELNTFREDINQLGSRMSEIQDTLNRTLEQSLDTIINNLSIGQNKISEISEFLKQRSDENLNTIIEKISQSSQSLDGIGQELREIAESNISSVVENITRHEQILHGIREELREIAQENLSSIIENINRNDLKVAEICDEFKQHSDEKLSVILDNINQKDSKVAQICSELKQNSDKKLSVILDNINQNDSKVAKICDEFKQNSDEKLSLILDNVSRNGNSINDFRTDFDTNFGNVINKLEQTDENLRQFRENIAANLTAYLSSIREMFAAFSQEVRSNNQNVSSEIFDKKLQELDNLSKDISSISKTTNEENFKDFLNSKVLEISDYLKNLEGTITSISSGMDTSIVESAEIKRYITNTAIRLDEIHSQLSTDINSSAKKIDDLKDSINGKFDDTVLKIDTMEGNLVKEFQDKIANFGQIKDDISESLAGNFDEIKSILEFLRANIPANFQTFLEQHLSANASSVAEIENLNDKITEISDKTMIFSSEIKELTERRISEVQDFLTRLENAISSTSLNLDNSLAEITEIKDYIADSASKFDETASNIVDQITNSNENIDSVRDSVKEQIEAIETKLLTMEDNLTKDITEKISELEQTKDVVLEANENINELKEIVADIQTDISKSSETFTENIENILTEKFEELEKYNEEQNTNAREIIDLINSLTSEIAETKDLLGAAQNADSETSIFNNLNEIRSSLSELAETSEKFSEKLTETDAFFVEKFNEMGERNDEHITNSVEIKNLINNLEAEIKEAKEKIEAIEIPGNEELLTEFSFIKTILDSVIKTTEDFSSKMNDIGAFFVDKFNEIGHKNEEQTNNVAEIKDLIAEFSMETKSGTEEICTGIADVKTDINDVSDKIDAIGTSVTEKFDSIYTRDEEHKNDTAEMKSLLNYLTDEAEKFNSSLSDSLMHNTKNTEEIFGRIEAIKEHISASKTDIENLHSETADKVVEKLFVIESKLYDSTENYNRSIGELEEKLNEYRSNIDLISAETNSKLNDSAAEFVDIKNNLTEIQDKISYLNTDQKSFFEENLTSIVEKIGDLTNQLGENKEDIKIDVKDIVRENITFVDKGLEYLTMTLDEIKTRQSDNSDEILNTISEKLGDVQNKFDLLKTDIDEAYREKSDLIIKEFAPLKNAIIDFTSFDFNSIITELKNQIEISYLNLLQELNNNLIENHDTYINIENTYKDVISKCTSLQSCVDDFAKNHLELINSTIADLDLNVRANFEKTDTFLKEWESYSQELDKKLCDNNKELEHSLLNVLDELQKALDEKVKAGSSELKDFIAAMLDNDDLLITMENQNEELVNQIKTLRTSLENKNNDIETSLTEIEKNVTGKLDEIRSDLSDKTDEETRLNKIAELLKTALKDLEKNIISKLTELPSADANISDEDIKELNESLKELHSKVDILALNDDSEIKDNISEIAYRLGEKSENEKKISDILENLQNKLNNLTVAETDETSDELSEINKNIQRNSEFDKKISDMLEVLNSKVDVLALSDDSDLREDISDIADKLDETSQNDRKISDILESLHNKLDNLAAADTNETSDDIAEINKNIQRNSEFDKKISDMLEILNSKVDVLALSDDSEIRDEIEDVKDLIVGQRKLIESFDSTKKSQEVDECLQKLLSDLNKIDLDKNTQEIKDSIMSAIISVADQITFVEETEEIKDFVEEKTNAINETLQEVKKQLKSIANNGSDMDLYSYTLQDVESDIAKLRLAINEISSPGSSNEVGVISSNINRIAKSIDDLRLSFAVTQNDDLNEGLDKLNEDIVSISARTNKLLLNSDESYRMICNSMDEFNRRTESLQEQLDTINSQNLQSQLLTIDEKVNATMSSSKVLENVMMYLGEWMDGTTDVVNSIYDKTSKTSNIQKAIKELKANLPEKEELINVIENKFTEQQSRIDKLEEKLEKAITMLEEREPDSVQNKIDKIEKQLAKLNSNIEKLTSYVDE